MLSAERRVRAAVWELDRHLGTTLPISSREWDLYRTFLSVGLLENVDLITADLSISIPTLRRRIARLESLHGRKLCRNAGSRFSLTRDGQALLNSLRSADEIIADLNQTDGPVRSGVARCCRSAQPDISSRISGYRWLNQVHRCLMTCVCGYPPWRGWKTRAGAVWWFQSPRACALQPSMTLKWWAPPIHAFGAYPSYVQTHGTPRLEELGEHVFIRSGVHEQ